MEMTNSDSVKLVQPSTHHPICFLHIATIVQILATFTTLLRFVAHTHTTSSKWKNKKNNNKLRGKKIK